MVFSLVHPSAESQFPLGALSYRTGEQYLALLVIEGVYASLVALANILVGVVLIAGRKQLFKNNHYIIVANMVACTSLKALVECAFVLPYYAIQRSFTLFAPNRVFSETHEFVIFNLSVLADYGTLFFSVLIALNRLIVVILADPSISRKAYAAACLVTWLISALFPIFFFIFKCQYRYSTENIYYNVCTDFSKSAQLLIGIAVYFSYGVALIVLGIYVGIFLKLRGIKRGLSDAAASSNGSLSQAETNILWQSFVVFVLYALAITVSLSTEFMDTGPAANIFLVIYLANVMNLAIAAVFPICLLTMSGDMSCVFFSALYRFGGSVIPSVSSREAAPRVQAERTFTI